MDVKDVLRYQLEASGKQVEKVLEGLDGIKWDTKMRDDLMSPKDVVVHLTECYIAARKEMAGEKHEWGSWLPNDDDINALLVEMRAERKKAVDALVAKADGDAMKAATDFIILHDAYHVGQLSALRMGLTPDWDPYAIYG